MSKKVLAEIYFSYGKGDGSELGERLVIDNTPEGRGEIFDAFSYDDAYDSKDDFINGKIDTFSFHSYGGDWDEPTGGYIVVSTREELINRIKTGAQTEIEAVKRLLPREQDDEGI